VILVQVVASGLLLGGVYALLAVGLTLIFGVMKLVNFAHGDFLMVAMYIAFVLVTTLGINPYLTIPVTAVVMFFVGAGMHHFFLRHTLDRGHSNQMVLTLGIATVLQSLALMIFSGNFLSLPPSASGFGASVVIGGVHLSTTRVVSFIVASVTTGALLLFMNRTLIGKSMRATSQDTMAAIMMGIPVDRIYLLAMGLGTALVGVAASILIPMFAVYPTLGGDLILLGFVVVVLGGLGNIGGAYVGGLIIGVVEAVSALYFGGVASQAIYFLLFVLLLLVRPQGLFRGEAG